MKRENKTSKISWRKSNLLKATVVSSMLLLLLVGSVQAIESSVYGGVKVTNTNMKAAAVELDTNSKWIRSGQELFFLNLGGQTRYVGIQAMMKVPNKIETGRYYFIPVYFTRFNPLSLASDQLSTSTDSVSKEKVIPISVIMYGGIATGSCPNSVSLLDDCFQMGIGIYNGKTWTNEIPIITSPKPTLSSNAPQTANLGYDQKIWLQEPDYRFLKDIPVGDWDGPYKIIVRIDPISYLPAETVSSPKENIPPPIPPASDELESGAIPISDSTVNKVSVAADGNDVSNLSKYVEKSNLKVVKSIELKEVEGKQVFQVKGVREGKLLWFIPIDIDVTVDIDVTMGSVNIVDRPWWGFLTS
jgi:hypothetical protein